MKKENLDKFERYIKTYEEALKYNIHMQILDHFWFYIALVMKKYERWL